MTETYTHISLDYSFQDRIATITMRRPEVHNAFNTLHDSRVAGSIYRS